MELLLIEYCSIKTNFTISGAAKLSNLKSEI